MQTRTEVITTYTFGELGEDAQAKALETLYSLNIDHDWWESSFEDFETVGKLLGLEIDNIYFSGFASQGDGACLEGSYSYQQGSAKAIREYAPLDEDLHSLADRLTALQRRFFYSLTANVKQSGHYHHAYSTDISIHGEMDDCREFFISDDDEQDLKDLLREFMQWIYSQLEKEFNYLTSEEAIQETIEANDYQFLEDGSLD